MYGSKCIFMYYDVVRICAFMIINDKLQSSLWAFWQFIRTSVAPSAHYGLSFYAVYSASESGHYLVQGFYFVLGQQLVIRKMETNHTRCAQRQTLPSHFLE